MTLYVVEWEPHLTDPEYSEKPFAHVRYTNFSQALDKILALYKMPRDLIQLKVLQETAHTESGFSNLGYLQIVMHHNAHYINVTETPEFNRTTAEVQTLYQAVSDLFDSRFQEDLELRGPKVKSYNNKVNKNDQICV